MKIIRALIRPEREEAVIEKLEAEGLYALTKIDVLGRGKQRGIQVGKVRIHTLSKVLIFTVVEDDQCEKAVAAICAGAETGYPGDGKIFVQEVSEAYTIRTGMKSGAAD